MFPVNSDFNILFIFTFFFFFFFRGTDPLVQHLQQFYDGHLLGWFGINDFDANTS